MNEDVKTKWVAALRSGDFKQGKGSLNSHGRYCCLGVLCELAAREGVVEKKLIRDEDQMVAYGFHDEGAEWEYANTGVLSEEVMEWAGIDSANPKITVNGRNTVAGMHNDSHNATFEEIAQGIEDSL